jgi:hypothetical protein
VANPIGRGDAHDAWRSWPRRNREPDACPAPALLIGHATTFAEEGIMGRILLGVIIGVILVIWLLASCLGAIF